MSKEISAKGGRVVALALGVAAILTASLSEARGLPGLPGLPAPPLPPAPNVSVNVSGAIPSPPGVYVVTDAPYRGKHKHKHKHYRHEGRKKGHKKHGKHH